MVRTVADVDRGLRKALKDGNTPVYKILLEEKRLVRLAMDKRFLIGGRARASGDQNDPDFSASLEGLSAQVRQQAAELKELVVVAKRFCAYRAEGCMQTSRKLPNGKKGKDDERDGKGLPSFENDIEEPEKKGGWGMLNLLRAYLRPPLKTVDPNARKDASASVRTAGFRLTGAGVNPDGNQQLNGLGAEVGKKKPGVSDSRSSSKASPAPKMSIKSSGKRATANA